MACISFISQDYRGFNSFSQSFGSTTPPLVLNMHRSQRGNKASDPLQYIPSTAAQHPQGNLRYSARDVQAGSTSGNLAAPIPIVYILSGGVAFWAGDPNYTTGRNSQQWLQEDSSQNKHRVSSVGRGQTDAPNRNGKGKIHQSKLQRSVDGGKQRVATMVGRGVQRHSHKREYTSIELNARNNSEVATRNQPVPYSWNARKPLSEKFVAHRSGKNEASLLRHEQQQKIEQRKQSTATGGGGWRNRGRELQATGSNSTSSNANGASAVGTGKKMGSWDQKVAQTSMRKTTTKSEATKTNPPSIQAISPGTDTSLLQTRATTSTYANSNNKKYKKFSSKSSDSSNSPEHPSSSSSSSHDGNTSTTDSNYNIQQLKTTQQKENLTTAMAPASTEHQKKALSSTSESTDLHKQEQPHHDEKQMQTKNNEGKKRIGQPQQQKPANTEKLVKMCSEKAINRRRRRRQRRQHKTTAAHELSSKAKSDTTETTATVASSSSSSIAAAAAATAAAASSSSYKIGEAS
eukprot:jgi/Bigna1/87461/estExt_fgenesh1_pg.C_200184